ncbi:hypothetical protein [Nocardioides acrostichi]|uniref:Glycosyltransferase RgtA/B/C/D-like domain-containing protein n=1 Tax=Nocardioides acrostichi TaxID=2784339 RepID=A0A930Y6V2_9ACTN|nr:hypothetical protein [Nocardioides acrostichi]MBF4162770.1 hypothetical protein [Nocardioides acrostichi]
MVATRLERAAGVLLPVVLVVAGRLPLFGVPLSNDEAGFSMLARQWAPGSSLYGDYWVDRPPLLLVPYGLADHLAGALGGTPTALRAVGLTTAVVSVLLAALLAWRTAPGSRWAVPATATATAALLANPRLDSFIVDGELFTLPALLLGLVLLGEAIRAERGRARWWLAVATGAVGAMGPLVKQNAVDVLLASGVVTLALLRTSGTRRRAAVLAGGVLTGAAAATGATVGWAASRGTEPVQLWHAAVTFRLHASGVIAEQASQATDHRAQGLLLAAVLAGLPLVLLLLPVPWRDPLPWVVLAWEAVAVAAGGSYWHHYLVGLVPGVAWVLAGRAAREGLGSRPAQRARWRAPTIVVAALTCSAVVGVGVAAADPPHLPGDVALTIDYLRQHDRPGDTGVVAFGGPQVLDGAGLASPYPYLWSLPVRVRDPQLTHFTHLLRSPRAPTWLVRVGDSLGSWGLDATTADQIVARRYRVVFTSGAVQVLERVPAGQVVGRRNPRPLA